MVYTNGSGLLGTVVSMLVLLFMIAVVYIAISGSRGPSSTVVREKLDSGNGYMNDCIVDEIGWFDNVSKTSSRLKTFWESTGVQPYIVLFDYMSDLSSDADKEEFSRNYYDEHLSEREDIFFFAYFAEKDVDNDVGYMCYVNGLQAGSVMDSEAIDMFWSYIDSEWYGDKSTDDMFVSVYTKLGKNIMKVSTTGKDILKWAFMFAALLVLVIGACRILKKKKELDTARAENTARVLNANIDDLAEHDPIDDLTNKYQ